MRGVVLLLLTLGLSGFAVGQELPSKYPPPSERGAHYLSIQAADSTDYPAVYPNPEVRDSIDAQYENHYKVARAIEQHMISEQNIDFLHPAEGGKTIAERKNRVWNLEMTNGDSVRLDTPADRFVHFFLEYYYQEHELVLFRLLYGKQVSFALVSRRTGRIFDVFGPPIFSPSNQWFASFHDDGMAGWSPNGLQVFRVRGKEIEKVIEYDMGRTAPGPARLKWIGESTFQLEIREHYILHDRAPTGYKHYRADIRKKQN